MSNFKSVLSMIQRAKTDNEKFAALLIVSKQTKSEDLSLEQRNELLNAIGVEFPIRLLATAKNSSSEDECNIAFAAIGSSVLSLFCLDEVQDDIAKAVPHLLKIAQFYSDIEGTQEHDIVNDCLNCLQAATMNDGCATKIVQSGGIKVLCTFENKYQIKSIKIVTTLLQKLPEVWKDNDFQNMMQKLAQNVGNEHSHVKFISCELLFKIMLCSKEPCNMKSYSDIILVGLEDILCSKITAEQRRPALMLASEVLKIFGVNWFISHCKNSKFIVILTRLACIESGLYLRNVAKTTILESDEELIQLLLCCYSIAENFCSVIAKFEQNESEDNDILTFEQIRLAQPALADLANTVFEHISDRIAQSDILPSDCEVLCLKTSIRFLGSWLNVENNLQSAQGIETLPILPQILDHLIMSDDLHLIKTLLPGIMIAADNTEAFKALMKSGILQSLEGVLSCVAGKHEAIPLDGEVITLLHLVVQTIINVCSSLSTLDLEQNIDDIKKLFKTVCKISNMELLLCSQAYVFALISIFFNMQAISEYSKSDFEKILNFLFDAYEVSNTKKEFFTITSKYKESWLEISSLWIMCGQEIVDCIQTNKTFKKWFQENKNYKNLTDMITAIPKDSEVKSLFSSLLEAAKG